MRQNLRSRTICCIIYLSNGKLNCIKNTTRSSDWFAKRALICKHEKGELAVGVFCVGTVGLESRAYKNIATIWRRLPKKVVKYLIY